MKLLSVLMAAVLIAFLAWGGSAAAHGAKKHDAPAAAPSPAAIAAPQAKLPLDIARHETSSEASNGGVRVLKRLHPATVHFPVALFLMAAVTELLLIRRPQADMRPAIGIMIYGGAAGAVIAALFGWIHTGLWFGGDAVMQVHRWNGTALAVAGVILAAIAARTTRRRGALRIMLFVIAGAVLLQGYLGGELAHGPNHLGLS